MPDMTTDDEPIEQPAYDHAEEERPEPACDAVEEDRMDPACDAGTADCCDNSAERTALAAERPGMEDEQHPTMHNKELGKRGEDAAAAFLERRGFDILERNWGCKFGEADIIALDEDALHFVEVKTRMSDRNGFPAEAVNANKRGKYERMAEVFLTHYDGPDTAVTFDIISILVTGEHRAFLRMHRNVFSNDCI